MLVRSFYWSQSSHSPEVEQPWEICLPAYVVHHLLLWRLTMISSLELLAPIDAHYDLGVSAHLLGWPMCLQHTASEGSECFNIYLIWSTIHLVTRVNQNSKLCIFQGCKTAFCVQVERWWNVRSSYQRHRTLGVPGCLSFSFLPPPPLSFIFQKTILRIL